MPSNGHSGGKLVVGYCHPGTVHECFMASMMSFREFDFAHEHRLAAVIRERGLYPPSLRNKIVKKFLGLPEQCEWLMMIDTDHQFEPHIPYQLMDSAKEVGALVMTALYFGILIDEVPMWWTTNDHGGMSTISELQLNEVHELAGFGAGMFIVHRSVLTAMGERYKDDPWQWFAHDIAPFDGGLARMGEDLCFCQRLTDMGIPMYGDARIRIDHEKARMVNLESFMKGYVPRKDGEKPMERILKD